MRPKWFSNAFIYLIIFVAVIAIFFTLFSSSDAPEETDLTTIISMARTEQISKIIIDGDRLLVTPRTSPDRLLVATKEPGTSIFDIFAAAGIDPAERSIQIQVKSTGGLGSVFGVLLQFLPLLFFGAIGLGFMLVEISQMQRLTVFLGHPTYGLSVVLFTLLLSGGAGSWLTQRIGPDRFAQLAPRRLLTLLVVLVATGWVTLPALRFCTDQTTPVRIGVAAALLCPAGIFMGMAFPLGMRQAVERTRHLAPWLLGINGAMSVCASVLAAAISLVYGISATFWLGVAAYAGAVFAFLIAPSAAASGPPGRLPPAAAPGATCSETESARLSRAG